MIVMFKCDNPDIKDYGKAIKLYSNQNYTLGFANNIVFALFKNFGKGYLYVDTEK